MSEFNYRVTVNRQLQMDEAATRRRSRKARQGIAYRHRRAALRSVVRTVAIDAALIGATLASSVILLACTVS